MARKICGRSQKESGHHGRKPESLADEITLRDEILALKRQVMILKRTNDQYSVRLRKYEDESRRKDKQLEQLMNPRNNADVTKMLSSKGAAILMNLKDQNNALIQMLLNKDLTIRRLVAEVKMSKLYASTKRSECYKAEISRLRNLLIKSEETLRENVQVQQEQRRSICAGGDPILEFSSSSDQSSPRDLDELRCTIRRLETHIKCSNDLLAQKNQEISLLSDELNFLRKYSRYRASKTADCDFTYHNLSAKTFTRSWPDPLSSKQLSSQDLLELFEKHPNTQFDDNLSRSAPAELTTFESDSTPEHALTMAVARDPGESHVDASACQHRKAPAVAKSLFNNLAANEVLKEDKMLSRGKRPLLTKNKWKQALMRFKELKKLKSGLGTEANQNEKQIPAAEPELELAVPMAKDILRATAVPVAEESLKESPENVVVLVSSSNPGSSDNRETDVLTDSCQAVEADLQKSSECSTPASTPNSDKDGARLTCNGTPTQTEPKTSQTDSVETETRKKRSLREVYCQSLDSSFESENGYATNREAQQVQVEVQINSVSFKNSEESGNSISGCSRASDLDEETDRICGPEFNDGDDDDDDDDVIVR